MDFGLSPEQSALAEVIASFAARELNDDIAHRDQHEIFSADGWARCAKMGLLKLPIPEEFGGQGADAVTTITALEALGYGCRDNGLIFSLNAQLWACIYPIIRFGSQDQKERYLPGLGDGSLIAAHAMSEPGSGSDAFALRTTAHREDDVFVLNGAKTFVTNAQDADLFLVFATTNRNRGFAALCAFLVDRDTPGLTVGKSITKMGLRTSPMADVTLNECRVPASAMVGTEGAGMSVFTAAMERERSFILASALGTMRRGVEAVIAHAQRRTQFDEVIGSFQAVAHRIVEMKLRLETARLMAYRLGWLIDSGQKASLESALTKLHISEAFVQSGLDAVQLFGGYGYTAEYGVERDLRDAVASRLYSGTSEIQRNLAARHLGLRC